VGRRILLRQPIRRPPYDPYPIGYHFTGAGWQQQSAADLGLGAFGGVTVRASNDVIAVGNTGQSATFIPFSMR
jgi:hypothetical protein